MHPQVNTCSYFSHYACVLLKERKEKKKSQKISVELLNGHTIDNYTKLITKCYLDFDAVKNTKFFKKTLQNCVGL